MIFRIFAVILIIIVVAINFTETHKVSKMQKDKTKEFIFINSNFQLIIWKFSPPIIGILLISNTFNTLKSNISILLQLFFLIIIPLIEKNAKNDIVILDKDSITLSLKKKILFKDIKYTNYNDEHPTIKVIQLYLFNTEDLKIKCRDEYESIRLYKKLQSQKE